MFNREEKSYSLGNFQLPQTNFNFNMQMPTPNLSSGMPQQSFKLLDNSQQLSSNLNSNSLSQNSFGFFSHKLNQPDPATIAPELVLDTSITLLKDQMPILEKGAFILGAAKAGQKLANNIQKDLDNGKPLAETVICKTLNTITETGLSQIATGAIVGGIPVYLTTVIENPLLIPTIPKVGELIPQAYSNASAISEMIGNAVEQKCHDGFAAARQISMGGSK